MRKQHRTRMGNVVAMMASLSAMGVGLTAPTQADAQVASYGAVQATRYVVAQPTTYAPVQPVAYTVAQPVQYTVVQPTSYVVTAPANYAVAPTATYAAAQPGGDPYGFTAWLNSVRAQYGLGAVSYDAGLEGWAAANNAQQSARGLGHFVMGPARRQNSAIGNSGTIGAQWMNSPAHRAALLDPSITRIGLAGSGSYWTFNAY